MKVVMGYPPNYDAIQKAFGLHRNDGIVFTYGDTIYNPDGSDLPDHLMEHEQTHERQQAAMTPAKWWEQYLADPAFRLSQEVEAYQVQYGCLCRNYNRKYRKHVLPQIAKHLASYMYGHVVTKEQATALILEGQHEIA